MESLTLFRLVYGLCELTEQADHDMWVEYEVVGLPCGIFQRQCLTASKDLQSKLNAEPFAGFKCSIFNKTWLVFQELRTDHLSRLSETSIPSSTVLLLHLKN